jgi:glycosyltransferase involved in cell wall biosynthesis
MERADMNQLSRRMRQARSWLENDGIRGAIARGLAGVSRRIAPPPLVVSVRDVDLRSSDVRARPANFTLLRNTEGPLTINWVMPPPGPNSGGHTTSFRIINHLESRGHRSTIYFYDVYSGDAQHYRRIIHDSYADVPVRSVFDGMQDADAVFATCWESAYPVFNSPSCGKRFYLVQDFEPWFHPAGSAYAFAENTYRMGFHGITAGAWLSSHLTKNYGMSADHFDFGCEVDTYRRTSNTRDSIAFYARPNAPRRAFELGLMALEIFAELRPDVEIHAFGDRIGRHVAVARLHDHGLVPPVGLNEIYNRCFAGLCLSMTNVSLVPHEMMSSGCIPVVNDAEHNRVVLDNPHVRYALPSPHELAEALCSVVDDPEFATASAAAATSVASRSWEDAGAAVEHALLRELRQGSS